MLSITTILPVLVAFLAAVPGVSAAGCYSSGVAFNSLHGGRGHNLRQEVKNDIHTTCTFLNGKTFRKNDVNFSRCTNWAKTHPDNEGCYEDCTGGCNALKEAYRGFCLAGCDSHCERPPSGTNHINWEAHINGDDSKVMTYDICKRAYETESGACQFGSDQTHDGFWFKIDPNAGAC